MRRSFKQLVGLAVMALLATVLAVVPATAQEGDGAEVVDYELELLHMSDLEGGIEALERAPNAAAIAEAVRDASTADKAPLISAGDNYIPGPFFNAAGDQATFRDGGVFNDTYNTLWAPATDFDSLREGGGRVDISIMNVMGFEASAIGNHEFDQGTDAMAGIIENNFRDPAGPSGDRWVGSQFPYLSANLDFSGDDSLSHLFTSDVLPYTDFMSGPDQSTAGTTDIPKLAPSALIDDGDGGQIGVVGATTPILGTISSPGDTTVIGPTTDDMPALAAVIQPEIDALVTAGADKIILATHLQQISLEKELVTLLSGVDIIIAGGSDTLQANAGDALWPGDTAVEPYPFVGQNKDGDTAVIVSTDGEYKYVGRLEVGFDADGKIDPTSVGGGPIRTSDDQVTAVSGSFAAGSHGALVRTLVDAVEGVVIDKDGNITGNTAVFLDGRRESVRTEETQAGNLSADANLWQAQEACSNDPQVSIKNGGGIRAHIGEITYDGSTVSFGPPAANPVSGKEEGQISQLDIENMLRFNNGLTCLNLTMAGLIEILEHGVAATEDGATPGQFPQVAGVSFSFDPTRDAGDRVRNVALMNGIAPVEKIVVDGSLVVNPTRRVGVVTLGFLAGGGDDYPFDTLGWNFEDLTEDGIPDGNFTFADPGSEQDAFAEFVAMRHPAHRPFMYAETPASEDLRIQNLGERSDAVLAGFGTTGPDVIRGDADRNGINGLSGNDKIRGKRGNDHLLGSFGHDRLNGDGGLDRVFGEWGNDVVLGGRGGDVLSGGPHRDRLAGQTGRDAFYIDPGADLETIVDLEPARDFLIVGHHWPSASDFMDDCVDKTDRVVCMSPVDSTVLIMRGVQKADLVPDRILQHPSDLP